MIINMINDFLIIDCIGKDDKLGLRINKEFFVHNLNNNDDKNINERLVFEIQNFLKNHNAKLDKNFAVIVNQGPGSFSGVRISLAVAKGLEISKSIKVYGYKGSDLRVFDKENVEKLLSKKLVEKKLIKPIYLS